MRTILCFAILVMVGCDIPSSPPSSAGKPAAKPAAEWYQGGNLHDKTVKDWRAATYENRLATCSDFVITLGNYEEIPPDLKPRAVALEKAIFIAVGGGDVDSKNVAEIAATCAVLLGY